MRPDSVTLVVGSGPFSVMESPVHGAVAKPIDPP